VSLHFTRNAQDLVPRAARSMVASTICSVFEQPDEPAAHEQCDRVIDGLRPRFPAVAELLAEAEPDLLGRLTFPESHRRQIRSTNPQERRSTLRSSRSVARLSVSLRLSIR
jgi:putative transposase